MIEFELILSLTGEKTMTGSTSTKSAFPQKTTLYLFSLSLSAATTSKLSPKINILYENQYW